MLFWLYIYIGMCVVNGFLWCVCVCVVAVLLTDCRRNVFFITSLGVCFTVIYLLFTFSVLLTASGRGSLGVTLETRRQRDTTGRVSHHYTAPG